MSNKPQNDRFKVDHKHLARELRSVGIEPEEWQIKDGDICTIQGMKGVFVLKEAK